MLNFGGVHVWFSEFQGGSSIAAEMVFSSKPNLGVQNGENKNTNTNRNKNMIVIIIIIIKISQRISQLFLKNVCIIPHPRKDVFSTSPILGFTRNNASTKKKLRCGVEIWQSTLVGFNGPLRRVAVASEDHMLVLLQMGPGTLKLSGDSWMFPDPNVTVGEIPI